MIPNKEHSSEIRKEIDSLLETFGEGYGKEDGESSDVTIDAIAAVITKRAQLVIRVQRAVAVKRLRME